MHGRKGYELVKEFASGEKGHLNVFKNELFERVIEECSEHHNALQSLIRVPCSFGICKTPLEVTSSQLIASELFPTYVVKVLLYPGAIANNIIEHKTFPSYSKLFKLYNNTSLRKSTSVSDLHRIEILAGSYLCVMGALIGFSSHGRMSLFGTMLIIWGILREKFMGQFYYMFPTKSFHMYPTLIVAIVCGFLSIRKDVRKLIHISKGSRVKLL